MFHEKHRLVDLLDGAHEGKPLLNVVLGPLEGKLGSVVHAL